MTDSGLNSNVHLRKELSAERETYINLRRSRYKTAYTNKTKEESTSNLSPLKTKGFSMLKKRIKDGDLLVLKTDKSGKLVASSPDAYLEMGKVHYSKDQEVTMDVIKKLSTEVAAHTSCWLKMFNVGEAHGHSSHFRRSFIGGDSPAPMYCSGT